MALAAVWANDRSNKRSQDTSLAVAKQQTEGQLSLAREARHQTRMESDYQQLLKTLEMVKRWALEVYITAHNDEERPKPPVIPELDEQGALRSAYWSPRVRQLESMWGKAVAKYGIGLWRAQDAGRASRATGNSAGEAFMTLAESQHQLLDLDQEIRAQIGRELLGQHDGHAEPDERVD